MPSPTASESYLAELNDAQREAVTTTEGPLLVVAGAGSGKTRVLTYRVAYLLEQGVKPNEILAITFTNKAAAEMRSRIEAAVGARARAIWILTFHAACGRILRREAERLGYRSNFTIYDQADQIRLVRSCLEELERDPKRFTPRGIHTQISNAKNQLIGPDEYAKRVESFYDQTVADVYAMYQRRLFGLNAVDFDDLLMLTVEVLQRFPEARERWAKAFRYVMVDEYQDTNHAQYVLLQLLSSHSQNLMVVGDPDQSIYRFRGADIGNILSFERDFPGTQVIPLEQNYRSTNAILNAANAVIENNRERKPKHLWSDLGEGEPVRVVETEDEHAEARFVAAEVAALLEYGFSLGEIAVVYRTNAQSRVLEDVFVRQGVAYQVIGGPRFYERAEIKDAIAYLQAIDNPYDGVSLSRIANKPRRGVGDTSVSKLQALADGEGISLWEAVGRAEEAGLATASLKAVQGWRTLLQSLMAQAQELSIAALLEARDRADGVRAVPALDAAEVGGGGEDREPRGARRGRAGVRGLGGRAVALVVPAGDLALLRPGRAPRRRRCRPGHADDAPQREGARVPRRLHARDGGGDLPALALDRGGRGRGGAPPLLRRDDAREGAADDAACRPPLALRAKRREPAVSVPRRAPGGGRRARAAAADVVVELRRAHPRAGSHALSMCPCSRPATRSGAPRSAPASSPGSSLTAW